MNEREQANQFRADLEAWLERGQMPDAPEGAEATDPQHPQGVAEAAGVSEASKAYRQALETACRLAQANPGADPGFRLGLEKRLRERARSTLPGLARRSRAREE